MDSGVQVLNSDSLSVVLGFRIPQPIIPDSPSRIQDSITWGDLSFIMEIATFCTTILLTPAAITVYIYSVLQFPRL